MSRSACANLTLCQVHYVYLREDVVQIIYLHWRLLPLESEKCAVVLPFAFNKLIITQYLQQFITAPQGLFLRYYPCTVVKPCVL